MGVDEIGKFLLQGFGAGIGFLIPQLFTIFIASPIRSYQKAASKARSSLLFHGNYLTNTFFTDGLDKYSNLQKNVDLAHKNTRKYWSELQASYERVKHIPFFRPLKTDMDKAMTGMVYLFNREIIRKSTPNAQKDNDTMIAVDTLEMILSII